MKKIICVIVLLIVITPFNFTVAGEKSENSYRTGKIRDLALIYQGGIHRIDWTQNQFIPYVTHKFVDGSRDWLFDGFLFLEFADGKGYSYSYGYETKQARKIEWEWLLNRLFEKGKSLDALNKCIENEKRTLGKPKFKHKIILGLTIPLPRQKNWGCIDGDSLDFNKQEDQIKATKWYIDQLITRFKNSELNNLELSGFYWVDEDIATCKDLPKYISQYIHSKKKEFIWIPYWKAKGYEQWKELGFDIAYQQPNHFFDKKIPDSRLSEACFLALKNGMAMEFEFDSKALFGTKDSSYDRLEAYLKAFEDYNVFATSAIAYYTGSKGMLDMYKSNNIEDHKIMDRFARHIIYRRSIKLLNR